MLALARRQLVLLAVIVGLVCVGGGSVSGLAAGKGSVFAETRGDVNRLYRIKGKVRFLLFWAGADDVGSARIVRRGGDCDQEYSLRWVRPRRAPRGVNEWGYVRESVAGNLTTIFGIRTVTDGDSPKEADARRTPAGGLAEFGVLCSFVSPVEAASRTTIVYVPGDATYRDVAKCSQSLKEMFNGRPYTSPGRSALPGILDRTRSDDAIECCRCTWDSKTIPPVPRMAYVYKDAVYDLLARRLSQCRNCEYVRARFGTCSAPTFRLEIA